MPSVPSPQPRKARPFPPPIDTSKLTLPNLIEARDAFHYQLSAFPNVVATAIGLERVRAPRNGRDKATPEKGLYNTIVTETSSPAILVFVDQWIKYEDFAKKPEALIPPVLYYTSPDGERRFTVPTCVLLVQTKEPAHTGSSDIVPLPESMIGGGNALLTTVQGRTRFGSVGCLATDGRKTYALTNQHVAADPETVVRAQFRGGHDQAVGRGSTLALRKKPFGDVYPGWAFGTSAYANVDCGLVDIDDASQWTTRVRGIDQLDHLANLDESTFTLDLIGCNVRAYGAASGDLFGEIGALFYRYKSVAGRDYVADFLIIPRTANGRGEKPVDHFTKPGDSGTLWTLEQRGEDGKIRYRPLALEWGGHVFGTEANAKTALAAALATNLSAILRDLDLDLLTGWNDDLPNYWGALGHYTIGAKACDVVGDDCKTFFENNRDNVSYPDGRLRNDDITSTGGFCPLADVPDLVWKPPMAGHKPAKGNRGPAEQPNHFTDADREDSTGRSLLDHTATEGDPNKTDARKIYPQLFRDYVDDLKRTYPDERKNSSQPGVLPFRVWQLYHTMTTTEDAAEFLAAAGVLAHYIGDSCQPLHCSYLHDGDPENIVTRTLRHRNGDTEQVQQPYGKGVHSAYETAMINAHNDEIVSGLDEVLGLERASRTTPKADFPALPELSDQPALPPPGQRAAALTIDLMRRSFARIPPKQLVATYAEHASSLWETYGDATILVQADGARLLAHLWTEAWKNNPSQWSNAAITTKRLEEYYQNPAWCRSYTLDTIEGLFGDMEIPVPEGPGAAQGRIATPA